ncbi:DNA-binding protein [Cryptococcus neoformans C23]|uniref:DNA-binding protein n=2 Tax=Cryptococcus neoformans TaxID=5207 RepID=A0A854Q620_CRYNE|nr:DNA-binding protein [Cryptococcus neoformans var. grubii H99]AUB27244.1 DNA-binding protein [Cryptococcus neoformans var. grubii]OWZ28956.1 DNA-binding protein [Cryptococcus neoformans var. grubii AD2-60a]OWZ35131.1 DNA-binding protein [Cryptococcus neoformans var. grubii AD1-83a]OWZ40906.1 DNA-binding protein [Cryptococcus neoformans var. grubii C23]OWZ51880.1 DNA-binding protein [Cryptococcus neoformans var. grubii 125.91]OWZ76388.1 DNA-binding protein [Cryptococcus neoformans var. grubi|eukprot:XP_012051859.1 DNA-binding protein [Cryptococcus neoformans var. grubii H99]
MSDKQQLLDMGFDPARIDWALRATNKAGLQPAMDHLLANSDKPIPEAMGEQVDEDDEEAVEAHIKKLGGAVDDSDAVAKSIKCSECGKIFRSQATASFHAEKSGHDQFEESTEEIKPLTEEEKKAKLQELREKLAIKRATQSKEDEKANRANEAIRRKAGQDTGKVREDLKLKEALKDAEQKKREKLEDQKARAAIKAQIEADKRERAEKAAREKALREGKAIPTSSSPVPTIVPKANTGMKSSENPETRLQVRLATGGTPMTKTFPSDNTLIDVAEWVASEKLEYNVDTIGFSMTFPRKTFSREDMKKSLKENGLTPSAVLIAN